MRLARLLAPVARTGAGGSARLLPPAVASNGGGGGSVPAASGAAARDPRTGGGGAVKSVGLDARTGGGGRSSGSGAGVGAPAPGSCDAAMGGGGNTTLEEWGRDAVNPAEGGRFIIGGSDGSGGGGGSSAEIDSPRVTRTPGTLGGGCTTLVLRPRARAGWAASCAPPSWLVGSDAGGMLVAAMLVTRPCGSFGSSGGAIVTSESCCSSDATMLSIGWSLWMSEVSDASHSSSASNCKWNDSGKRPVASVALASAAAPTARFSAGA